MNEHQFYEELLWLPGFHVTAVESRPQRIDIQGYVEVAAKPCPVCGEATDLVNQYDTRRVQDLSISGKAVYLHVRVPQRVCSDCRRYFTDSPSWMMPGKSYTKRQAKWIVELCAKQPFTEVAALVNLSHKTVERLYYEMAHADVDLPTRYAQVRKLGIDEVAHRKGKRDFLCVLTDLERGIQLDVLPDRKKATLTAHFAALGVAFCEQIEVVACDMWSAYRDVAEACFPNAQVVVDRFHVVKALNAVLDGLRKHLRAQHQRDETFKAIKWLLFKRPEQLSLAERQHLEVALSKSWLLAEIYALRNSFHALFEIAPDAAWLEAELAQWMAHAETLKNKYLDGFVGTLGRWLKPIAAFASTGLTNAVTEGLNNYLRYFTRISFGLPKFEHMRLRILMATG